MCLILEDAVVQFEDVNLADCDLPLDVVIPQLVRLPLAPATSNSTLVLGPKHEKPCDQHSSTITVDNNGR